ncbi:tyrosine-type recombinase/integrase [Streptomyces mirabilis]|uniref:tyrosine-type recombinase/integrase n=1 Tax=Streptomyces mirabilis TaxID=68239 RepID=UPI003325CDF9
MSRETRISLENRDCCAQADPRQPDGNGSPAHGPRDTGTGTEVPHRGRRPDGPLPGSRIEPCGNRACDGGLTHHCLRDAPLWTVYAATDVRRSEALGMRWSLVHWEEGAIALGWVVVEEGNTYRLRKLTKEGDDNALIYVDQSVMNVLKWQKERHDAERARLGAAWVDHDLVFARDGFKLYRGEAGGPQDPEKVSARWRTPRTRLKLPEEFRIHYWRHSKVTSDLEAGENPVEVSANVRHHSPGCTTARYGHSRKDGVRKLAASGGGRLGLSSLVRPGETPGC